MGRIVVVVAVLGVGLLASAGATTYLVRPDGTGDFPTIQAAINAAAPDDVIELADGIFTGTGNRDLDYFGKAITVRSRSWSASACIIDCQASPSDSHRGFVFQSGEMSVSVLEGITVTGGSAWGPDPSDYGGGLLCLDGSAPLVRGCLFVANSANHGGAALCLNSSPTFVDCVFRSNTAVAGGGGVYCTVSSSPVFLNCSFIDNQGDAGGGLHCRNSSAARFEHCAFSGNAAVSWTGGAAYSERASLDFTDCIFSDNVSALAGGALACTDSSQVVLHNCVLFGNSTGGNGGGLSLSNTQATLTECQFTENTAPNGGGLDVSAEATSYVTTLSKCTFWRNNASYAGAVVVNWYATVNASECTVVANAADVTSGLCCGPGSAVTIWNSVIAYGIGGGAVGCDGSATVFHCSDLYGNAGGDWVGTIADQLGTNGNFSADPCFCDADNDDFTLWNYSPCAQVGCGTIGAWPVACWDAQGITDSDASQATRQDMMRVSASPNPFSETTSIRFASPTPGAVRIGIFDMAGREVKSLIVEGVDRGSPSSTWDGRDRAGLLVPAGVYWVRASQGGREASTRVMVVR